jgi:hypothetical protein
MLGVIIILLFLAFVVAKQPALARRRVFREAYGG